MVLPPNPTVQALLTLRPNAQWAIIGTDLSTLRWDDTVQVRPTDDEINAQIASQGD